MSEVLKLYGITIDNQGLQSKIDALENQIQTDKNPEKLLYDELVLEREKLELAIREKHPELDPMTQEGAEALRQIQAQDPEYQRIEQAIETLKKEFPAESTSWGTPMASGGNVKYFQVGN